MTALWIVGAVVLALGALALIPVRIDAAYANGIFTLTGRAGPVPVKLFQKGEAKDRKPEKNAGRDGKSFLRRAPLPVLRLLAQSAYRPVGWLIRRVRVKTLRLRYLAAGPDPYNTAMAYARAGLAMEGIARMVPGADLRADVDFDGARSALDGQIAVSVRFGEAVYAAACFGIGFLRGYYRYQREKE